MAGLSGLDSSEMFEIWRVFFVSFTDAVNSINEGQLTECSEVLAQLFANYIQFEIDAGQIENAITIAAECVNNLPAEFFASQSMMSLLVIRIIVRNLDVLQQEVISKFDHLITLKTDECVYEYAKYLLETVCLVAENLL